MKSWGHFHEVSINWVDLRSVFHQIVVQFTDGICSMILRLCVFNFFMNESTNALIHYQLLPPFAIFGNKNKKWRFANMKICKMKICQSPCRKYERVRAMRRRETRTMHILDKKCNFCLKIKQKWVNLYSIHAAIEFPMFFGAISFMEGCIFEFVEIFSSLCYPSLSRIGKTSLFFQTHTNASLSDF